MSARVLPGVIATIAVSVLLFNGCVGHSTSMDYTPGTIQEPPVAGLPAFPGDNDTGVYSAVHRTSEVDTEIPGITYTEQSGENNYELPPIDAYVIAPGAEDDLAYAMYDLAGLGVDRPISIDLGILAAPVIPGSDDPLPLNYWVGLSNYTEFSWEWFGPFDEPLSLVMNSEQVIERYIGSAGVLHYLMVTTPGEEFITPENPDGLTACQINVCTVTTEDASTEGYYDTKPLFVSIESHTPSSLPPPKGGSDLDPSQYVTLNWTHVADNESPDSGSTMYEVYRRGPDDPIAYKIGRVDAPATTYIDPLNNDVGVQETVPGWTYTYSLRAWNGQGHTGFDSIIATVPVLEPGWVHTWGKDGDDQARDVLVDADGDIYTVGVTRPPSGTDDLLMTGYTADGTLETALKWGGVDNDSAYGICGDSSGNKFITGMTRSWSGQPQLCLLMFNNSDQLQWDKTWGVDDSSGLAVACDADGLDIYVTGTILEGQNNIIMLRFDNFGDIVTLPQDWSGRWADFTNNKSATGQDIAINSAFEVFIAGGYSTDLGNNDAVIMKVNADRTLAWAKTWGTAANDEATALVLDPADGSIYFTGWHANDQLMVVKMSSNGAVVWQTAWGIPGNTGQGNDLILVNGRLYVVGDSAFDVVLLEFDPANGDLISQRIWGEQAAFDAAKAIAVHPASSSLMIAGVSPDNTSEWVPSEGVISGIDSQSALDIPFVYDPGFNTTQLMAIMPDSIVDGTQDTGGGGNDSLLAQFKIP